MTFDTAALILFMFFFLFIHSHKQKNKTHRGCWLVTESEVWCLCLVHMLALLSLSKNTDISRGHRQRCVWKTFGKARASFFLIHRAGRARKHVLASLRNGMGCFLKMIDDEVKTKQRKRKLMVTLKRSHRGSVCCLCLTNDSWIIKAVITLVNQFKESSFWLIV